MRMIKTGRKSLSSQGGLSGEGLSVRAIAFAFRTGTSAFNMLAINLVLDFQLSKSTHLLNFTDD